MTKRASRRDRIANTLQRTTETAVTAEFTNLQGDLQNIPLTRIVTREQQPRKYFDEVSLQSLTESVKQQGVIQPIIVHQRDDGSFELVAGERRLRAAKRAGLATVPAKVLSELSESQIVFVAAMENLQREDLNPVDEVDAVTEVLSVELGVSKEALPAYLSRLRRFEHNVMSKSQNIEKADWDATKKLEVIFSQLSRGKWQSFVANKLGVLRLPRELLEAVRRGELAYTKAVVLRKVKDPKLRADLLTTAPKMSIEELRHKIREATTTEQDEAANLASRLGHVAKVDKWRSLEPSRRKHATKLIEQLEALFVED